MARESLLEQLEELASKATLLHRGNGEALVRIQVLECEIGELRDLISLAESKADEMLHGGSAPDSSTRPVTPKTQVTTAPLASKGLEELVAPSVSEKDKPKRRFPIAFSFD